MHWSDCFSSDLKDLPDLYDRRLAASAKLESAETALLGTAIKLHNKEVKASFKASGSDAKVTGNGRGSTDTRPLTAASLRDVERDVTPAERLVPVKSRPIHRLPLGFLPFSLPFIGRKVDSIEWAREEIKICTEELERERRIVNGEKALDSKVTKTKEELEVERKAQGPEDSAATEAARSEPKDKLASKDDPSNNAQKYPPLNSVFVQFNKQIAAQLATQVLAHHEPYRISGESSIMVLRRSQH